MSIYIGGDRLIFKKNIIAILDSRCILESKKNKNFLRKFKDEKIEQAKTYILTQDKGDIKLYGSNISSTSMEKNLK